MSYLGIIIDIAKQKKCLEDIAINILENDIYFRNFIDMCKKFSESYIRHNKNQEVGVLKTISDQVFDWSYDFYKTLADLHDDYHYWMHMSFQYNFPKNNKSTIDRIREAYTTLKYIVRMSNDPIKENILKMFENKYLDNMVCIITLDNDYYEYLETHWVKNYSKRSKCLFIIKCFEPFGQFEFMTDSEIEEHLRHLLIEANYSDDFIGYM